MVNSSIEIAANEKKVLRFTTLDIESRSSFKYKFWCKKVGAVEVREPI